MSLDFDEVINRVGTHSVKWDACQSLYGVDPNEGIAMWVADMDFRPPQAVNDALSEAVAHGVHGYFGNDAPYKSAIVNWMQSRHGWEVDPAWISTTHGLVSAVGLCLQAFTAPGDGVILFTPVYHAFAKMINANDRVIVESETINRDGRYEMDLDGLAASLSGNEKMVILCSPHNPGGRVWTAEELSAVADFCIAHDLMLISDEIHHDLTMPGQTHHVMHKLRPDLEDRLLMLTAASKTFNLAGGMTGNVIIPNAELRARFQKVHLAAGASPNRFGILMTTAAYTHGAEWLDELRAYLDGNRQIFDAGVNAIPGLKSMALEATYLAWVDFSGTGMGRAEFTERVEKGAKIAANYGPTFGTGGETFLRFNIATPRPVIEEAVRRLQEAFADLQ
ncbi:MAG: MalY/PatB family protein [Pseudomonadota bacterium]